MVDHQLVGDDEAGAVPDQLGPEDMPDGVRGSSRLTVVIDPRWTRRRVPGLARPPCVLDNAGPGYLWS
jgi:hypothetical protein